MASLVGIVNAVLAGTSVALLTDGVFGLPRPAAVALAVAVAVALAVAASAYQRRRFARALDAG